MPSPTAHALLEGLRRIAGNVYSSSLGERQRRIRSHKPGDARGTKEEVYSCYLENGQWEKQPADAARNT
ncbi:hypothetical protein AB205_0213180 [Aquarana catesbeiana]|uniref:Uncharacterized protein n=1 Tax=Aquarana catesbeiana TaxID=8400 RepID=A0A2G9RF13_AQUCT|nr:hypothetical protein AB205_0213180 [Aquarana catesbeiana]